MDPGHGQHLRRHHRGQALLEALQKARQGMETPIVALLHAMRVELWLRAVRDRGILKGETSTASKNAAHLRQEELTEPLSEKEFC